MFINSTPQLSEEGTKGILAELEAPKKDSPMLKKLRKSLEVVEKMSKNTKAAKKEPQHA